MERQRGRGLLPGGPAPPCGRLDHRLTRLVERSVDPVVGAGVGRLDQRLQLQAASPALLRSPRPALMRQCSVRPLRCRPEQRASISARQCSTISGLSEKSSISIRR
ncbi:hypothetical protein EYF80_062222 [Liparis tanakae]|uniref:Uncharacterized protein n=1 Tax=Liparis tanakae TaxID=230148 RepID=A0A4Z2EGH6_9TELE|nr:hypothetical protein EYF80_062222 [Liparis tanakae]